MFGTKKTGPPGVAVVTEGTAGIGRATVRELASRGWDVAVLSRGQERLDETVDEVRKAGRRALGVSVDVADHAAVDAAADRVERELGPIDLWVNNAFTGAIAFFDDIEPEEYERITAVTYFGFINGTRSALRRMTSRNRGTIIQVGSALAFRGIPLQAPYCGAKAAIENFTESLRVELEHKGSAIELCQVHMPGCQHAAVRLGPAPRSGAPPHAGPADLPTGGRRSCGRARRGASASLDVGGAADGADDPGQPGRAFSARPVPREEKREGPAVAGPRPARQDVQHLGAGVRRGGAGARPIRRSGARPQP
jgi:NAD(P)-dependent dehydrogenase (short-subunit alcohol dehydrogenase family)